MRNTKNIKNLLKNDEAVSGSVGFILMFAITIIVFVLLIMTFYGISNNIERSAANENFKALSERLVAKITAVDLLINTTTSYGGTINTFEYKFPMPETVAADNYIINITNATSINNMVIESDNGARVTVPFGTHTNFDARKIYSGTEYYKISFDKNASSLYVEG